MKGRIRNIITITNPRNDGRVLKKCFRKYLIIPWLVISMTNLPIIFAIDPGISNNATNDSISLQQSHEHDNTHANANADANAQIITGDSPANTSTAKKSSPSSGPTSPSAPSNNKKYSDFLKWCQTALGIQTLVRIQDFDYVDHLKEWKYQQQEHPHSRINAKETQTNDSLQMVKVRGLAATRKIDIGEILISVPYHALLTLHTTIDHDPVLSQILGPEQRLKYGWMLHQTVNSVNANQQTNKEISQSTSYYEIVLLIVAVLYHVSLGRLSPLWFYIETLTDAPVDQMPFLWSEERMRKKFDMKNMHVGGRFIEVKKLVMDIKMDVREMYDGIMDILVKEHKDIFAPAVGEQGAVNEVGWAFSYERFEWAFAMVNSRHWHLPLQDLDETIMELRRMREDPDPAAVIEHGDDMNTMPANQPTDEYISLQDEALKMESIEEYVTPTPALLSEKVTKHSFMAPLADMLNFGPPCARGQYNTEKKAFEVVATCSFQAGQEVTFWYSDDCEDVMISNYGFTHPMVTRCPTIEDWQYRAKMWKNYAENVEETLSDAYEDLYDTLQELKGCNCDDDRIREPAPAVVKAADDHAEKMKHFKKKKDQVRVGETEKEKQKESDTQEKQESRQNNEGNGQGGIRRTKRSSEEERDDVGL